jgi:hypothetical protein
LLARYPSVAKIARPAIIHVTASTTAIVSTSL